MHDDPTRAREPAADRFGSRVSLYVAATRPAFALLTAVGVGLGISSAYYDLNHIGLATAALTLVFAVVAHAGVNVVNDYFDALNGTDERNVDRIFPFTGGSRFIQNQVLTLAQTRRFGYALLGAVIPAGLLLMLLSGPGLLLIGLTGLFVGWSYSATPLKLGSRGLGEVCVVVGILSVVVGADYVQRESFAVTPLAAGLPYALLSLNILFINQFPDRRADIAAGKLHWVARLEPSTAAWVYVVVAGGAAWLVSTSVLMRGCLPDASLIALSAFIPSAFAARQLVLNAEAPSLLAPAIKATIGAALLYGLILSGALVASP